MIDIKSDKKQNSFMGNIIILIFSQIIIKIVGLVYKVYLTNKEGFGDKGNAIYGSAFQIYALFLTISSIGVPNAISKLVSSKTAIGDNKGAYRIFKVAFALFGFLGFVASSILFFEAKTIATIYLQIPEAEIAIMTLAPSVFLVSIASVMRGYFNGRENLSVTANSQSLEQIYKTIFTLIIVGILATISYNNTVIMVAGTAIATTLATFFSLIYLYIYFIKRKREVWQELISSKTHKKDSVMKIIKNILKVSVPIALCALLSAITKTIDTFTVVRILKESIGEEEATMQYGILTGKVDTLITLPFSFNMAFATALIPSISTTVAKKQTKIAKRRIENSLLITILIGLPCTVIMSTFSNQILNLLFPNAFEGGEMLKYASWTIIFIVLIQTINGALQGLGKVNAPVFAFIIGAIIKLILNNILIRCNNIGIKGAIISSIVSHVISFIICLIFLKRNLNISLKINKFLIKPIIASTVMMMEIRMFYKMLCGKIPSEILLIISIFVGIVMYIVLICLLRILSDKELKMIPYGQKICELKDKRRKNVKKAT